MRDVEERFYPRPRPETEIHGRSCDVLFTRGDSESAESVPYATWDVLSRFDGTTDVRALARAWATPTMGAEALTARLLGMADHYQRWYCGGAPEVLPARDLPETRRVDRHAHRVGDTDIPARPLLGAMTVTYVCNLRCNYCFQDHAVHSEAHPTVEKLLHVVKAFHDAEVPRIRITGGEPTSHPQFAGVLLDIARRGIKVSAINTNGTMITPAIIDALRVVRPDQVSVSLDAIDPDVLDALYGVKGSGTRAMDGIDRLVSAGLRVCINFTVVAGGARYLDETLRWAIDHGVQVFSARGCKDQASGVQQKPSKAEDDAALAMVDAWQAEERGITVRTYQRAWPQDTKDKKFLCTAVGTGAVMIDPQGQAVPCDYFVNEPEFAIGNVHERPLTEIWGGADHRALWEAWYRRPKDPAWRDDCSTNCPAVALRQNRGPLAGYRRPSRKHGLPVIAG